MPEYGLICPFLDDSAPYAHGVEFGMLWNRLKEEEEIKDYFTTSNQEQITLAANRLGWEIVEMKPWGTDWIWFHLRKPGFVA